MWLAVIEPVKPGEDKLIFECTDCGREEFVEVKLSDAAQPVPPLERFRAC
jgi:hypothetical protein